MEQKAIKVDSLEPPSVTCQVDISIEDERWESVLPDVENISEASCIAAIGATSLGKSIKECEISILLTNDETIQVLNRDYRDKDKPTNVLSFPSYELTAGNYKSLKKGPSPVTLGDVIVALETVQKEAEEQGKSVKDHFCHLMVHGTLHLLGYDHEEDEEAEVMETLEIKVLEGMRIGNPYG